MRVLTTLLLSFLVALPAWAGELEDRLRSGWHASWVIVDAGTASSCDASYTNNTVFDGRVRLPDGYRLEAGELATVHKVNVHRSRIDVLVDLAEPVLLAYSDGPFELYREAICKVELQFEVDRRLVKDRSTAEIEALVAAVLERHTRRGEAESSPGYNGRSVEAFPEDYDQTEAAYFAWREQELVRHLSLLLSQTLDEARRIADRVREDPAYSTGLTHGLRSHRGRHGSAPCEELLNESFHPGYGSPPSELAGDDKERWQEGHRNGQSLSYHLDLAERLEICLR